MLRLMQLSCMAVVFALSVWAAYSLGVYNTTPKTVTQTIPIQVQPEPEKKQQKEVFVHYNRFSEQELKCLALNIYHEARGESVLGQEAVAWVTLNRVAHPKYPNDVCKVVKQGHYSKWFKEVHGKLVPLKNKCHFSWWCDGRDDTPKDSKKWAQAKEIAYWVSMNWGYQDDPTRGAIMYHANYVKPYWRTDYEKLVVIDKHIFYGESI